MKSVNTVLIELCLLHYMIGWRNSTNLYKQVKHYDVVLTETLYLLSHFHDLWFDQLNQFIP